MSNQQQSVSFDPKSNPAACAAKKEGHYRKVDNVVQLVMHKGNPYLAATDGRALSMVRCETVGIDSPENVRLERQSIEFGAKAAKSAKTDCRIVIEDRKINAMGLTTERLDTTQDGQFPDVCSVIPESHKRNLRVALNVKLLAQLAKGIGADAIELEFDPEQFKDGRYLAGILATAAVAVKNATETRSFGVIMPLSGH